MQKIEWSRAPWRSCTPSKSREAKWSELLRAGDHNGILWQNSSPFFVALICVAVSLFNMWQSKSMLSAFFHPQGFRRFGRVSALFWAFSSFFAATRPVNWISFCQNLWHVETTTRSGLSNSLRLKPYWNLLSIRSDQQLPAANHFHNLLNPFFLHVVLFFRVKVILKKVLLCQRGLHLQILRVKSFQNEDNNRSAAYK